MRRADYGEWESKVTPEWLTHSQKKFGSIVLEGSSVYWEEMRDRSVVMERKADGQMVEHTPEGMSARTRVHEYGGLCFCVVAGKVYYVNDKDQRIYCGSEPISEAGVRCADLHAMGNCIVGVGEKGRENFLFSLHLPTGKMEKMASGRDFYSSPAVWGDQIAYLTWDLPNMPWDGTELWVGERKVAGGRSESIFQPQWSPSGLLHYVSDRTGWWNIYTEKGPVTQMEAEFGLPGWVFGMSTYAFAGEEVVATYTKGGEWFFEGLPWTYYTQIRSTAEKSYFIAASATMDRSIVEYDRKSKKTVVIAHNPIPHFDVSMPELITFPSQGGRKAHGIYYPPHNKAWRAPEGKLPPLIVMLHGGPTAEAFPVFDLKIQFWTSRGFAVVDVNYGGSTGFGREYRDRLKKMWGVVDVEDCEAAAKYLIAQGKADPKRIAIRGGSAGGYTALAALTFTRTFTVGASYYGVSDLCALAEETHKFESRYLDELIGPYPAAKKIYEERSPLFHVDKLTSPVIFFQGAEDLVVPVAQAETLYNALKKKKIPTELIIYPDEQHGFRKVENIKDSLVRELEFYIKVWKS